VAQGCYVRCWDAGHSFDRDGTRYAVARRRQLGTALICGWNGLRGDMACRHPRGPDSTRCGTAMRGDRCWRASVLRPTGWDSLPAFQGFRGEVLMHAPVAAATKPVCPYPFVETVLLASRHFPLRRGRHWFCRCWVWICLVCRQSGGAASGQA